MQSKQWKHPGSPPPKKFKRVHSAGKVTTSIFWDSQGLIMINLNMVAIFVCLVLNDASTLVGH